MKQKTTKDLYNDLILRVLVENNVKTVFFMHGDFAKHYDHVIVRDGGLSVYLRGLSQPFNGFHCDFTLDYANLLASVEKELFLAVRSSQSAKADIIFAF